MQLMVSPTPVVTPSDRMEDFSRFTPRPRGHPYSEKQQQQQIEANLGIRIASLMLIKSCIRVQ